MKNLFLLLLLFVLGATPIMVQAKTIYVNNRARQAGDGSQTKPFQTLEEAQAAVRTINPKTEAIEVLVAQGDYYLSQPLELTKEDSGTEVFPVTWRANLPHLTSLHGGKVIPPELFKPVTEDSIRTRLDSTAAKSILCVDLAALGIAQLPTLGTKMQMPLAVPELFVNGKRMTMARWPNNEWTTVKKIIDGGSQANSGNAADAANPSKAKEEPPRGGTFEYEGERPLRWNAEKGVWLHGYWCFDWASEVLKVATINPEKHEITLASQHVYGLRQGNPSPRRWIAIHLLEELDSPGEYYVDATNKKLYFFPSEKLEEATIVLAWQNQPIVAFNEVSHFLFSGFTVEESWANAITVQNCKSIRIEQCVVRNARQLAISIVGGEKNVVHSCLIEQTGTGGISVLAGDRKTLTPANHLIENNVIRSFSQHRLCYANGLALAGVGNTARHNELYDAPHQAISMSGNDMVFEYNIVHHVCLTGDDCGALYKGRNPSMRGNIIRYNFWYDIGSPRGHGNAAIYFDDGDGGEVVYGNIFLRTGDPGKGSFGSVFSHGGHGNKAENNIFIDCKRPLGSAPWNDKRWKDYIDAELWQTRLLYEVDITKSPYTERYPELIGFMNGESVTTRINVARKNVFVNCPMEKSGNWDIDTSNWNTEGDPGFVNMKENNFTLRDDSEVFNKIPGFLPIPFSKIGPMNISP